MISKCHWSTSRGRGVEQGILGSVAFNLMAECAEQGQQSLHAETAVSACTNCAGAVAQPTQRVAAQPALVPPPGAGGAECVHAALKVAAALRLQRAVNQEASRSAPASPSSSDSGTSAPSSAARACSAIAYALAVLRLAMVAKNASTAAPHPGAPGLGEPVHCRHRTKRLSQINARSHRHRGEVFSQDDTEAMTGALSYSEVTYSFGCHWWGVGGKAVGSSW
jgi:hypothetical protein